MSAEASFDDDSNKEAFDVNKILSVIIAKKMGYKLCSNITCPNPTEGATENNSSLLRNVLSAHHTFSKWTYSNYQVIKISENCFQSINCSSRIKLVPVLIHLRY